MSLARLGEFNFLVKFDGERAHQLDLVISCVFGLNLTRICGFGYNFDVFLKNRVFEVICARRRYGEFYTFVKFDGKRRHHLNFVVKCLFRLDLTRIVGFCTIPTFFGKPCF